MRVVGVEGVTFQAVFIGDPLMTLNKVNIGPISIGDADCLMQKLRPLFSIGFVDRRTQQLIDFLVLITSKVASRANA